MSEEAYQFVKYPAAVSAIREVLARLNPRLVVVFSQTVFKNYLPNYDRHDEGAEKYIQSDAGGMRRPATVWL
jgi:hypothetical protein